MTAKYWLGYPVGTLALASAISLPSQAEETTTAKDDTLDTVTIFGESYRSTGTKSELQPMEAPMSFERVDAEDLEDRQVNSVDEAIQYSSGVTPESRGSAITIFDQYTLRGFGTYNNYYNGLPLQYLETGNLAPQVDMYASDGIELLKGPASVLYGASSPGGMINQLAKQPQPERETEIQVTTGSNSLIEVGADTTGSLNDALDYRLIALGRTRDGQQDGTEEERWVVAPSATWYIGDNSSLNLNAYYQDDPKAIPSTPLPAQGSLNEASYDQFDAETFVGDHNWGTVDKTVTMLGYKFNHDFSSDLTFLQNFRYTSGELLQKNSYFTSNAHPVYGANLQGNNLRRYFYFTDEELSSFVVDNQLAYSFDIGNISNNALVGLEYHNVDFQWDYGDDYGLGAGSVIDLSDINNNQVDPDNMNFENYAEYRDVQEQQIGIYFQDEISFGNTTAVAGIRYDKYDASDDFETSSAALPADPDYNTNGKTEVDQDNISLRLAAIHYFDNGLSPYASYSESYLPVVGNDFEGNALDPETANQYEAGVKFGEGSNLELTAAAFWITKENIKSYKTGVGYVQTGEVQSRGVELGGRVQLIERLNLMANLTLMDVEITENEGTNEGNTPSWVAEQTASIWADFAVTQALSVSGGVRYVGEMEAGNDNSVQVPAYTLVDAASSYAINEHYSLGLSVGNLFDEEYMSCSNGEYGSPFPACWYGSPRNMELSFTARF